MPDENKYQANRNHIGENNKSDVPNTKTEKMADNNGSADYFTGGKGEESLAQKIANAKLGDKALGALGNALKNAPKLNRAAERLNDFDKNRSGLLPEEIEAAKKRNWSTYDLNGNKDGNPSSTSETNNNDKVNKVLNVFGKKSKKTKNKLGDWSHVTDEDDSNGDDSSSSSDFSLKANIDLSKFFTLKTKICIGIIIFLIFIIFSYIIMILDEADKEDKDISSTAGNGSCMYSIKGFTDGSRKIQREVSINNLKVKLMECDGSKPVYGEELIDFEKYILGVTYQENGSGSDEGVKTEAVAARSFALSRPAMMGNSGGTKLYEEDGQWILQLRACTNDQAYCDPDKGCWSNAAGGESGKTMHSGQDTTKAWSRGPVAADSKLRTLVAETKGQVLVDSSGYILSTGYRSTDQRQWNSSAFDYKQILLQHYSSQGASDILQMSCTTSSQGSTTGEFTNWKQYDPAWATVNIGNSGKTIKNIGCTVTSISMLIAKSGVPTNIENFNPGTFVQALNNNNGFTSGGSLYWSTVSKIIPNFEYQGQKSVAGKSRAEKLQQLNELLNNGYFVTAEVKGNTGQHWVAVDNISGENINMFDPASTSTDMWSQYSWTNTSTYAYFKVI